MKTPESVNETRSPFSQLAERCGIDESTAIGLMSVVYRGMSSREDEILDLLGESSAPQFHVGLVDDRGGAAELLDRLLMTLRKVQRLMERKFSRVDPQMLKEAWLHGDARETRGLFRESPADQMKRQQDLVFGATPTALDPLNEAFGCPDLQDDSSRHRIDLALRPRILLEGASPGDLKREVARLRCASGLVCGLRIGEMGKKDIEELLQLIDGVRLPIPEMLQAGSPGATESSDATLLLAGRTNVWSESERMKLADQILLLRPEVRAPSKDQEHEVPLEVLRAWSRAVQGHLSMIRWGVGSQIAVAGTDATLADFARRYDRYVAECRSAELDNDSVRELPRSIARMLRWYQWKGDSSFVVENEMIFRHAEILRDRHLGVLDQLRGETETYATLDLAFALLDRIVEKQPITLRDLVRSFNIQKVDRYLPTLNLMVEAGVIIEQPTRIYREGEWHNYEGTLRRAIAARRLRVAA